MKREQQGNFIYFEMQRHYITLELSGSQFLAHDPVKQSNIYLQSTSQAAYVRLIFLLRFINWNLFRGLWRDNYSPGEKKTKVRGQSEKKHDFVLQELIFSFSIMLMILQSPTGITTQTLRTTAPKIKRHK